MAKKINVILAAAVFLAACAEIQTRRESPDAKSSRSGEVNDFAGQQGDRRDGREPAPEGETGSVPAPTLSREELKVAVILGPGGYKAFAHAGVLKELKKNNIPIHGVVGIEWGALIGGLFAQRGQINEAEWKLYKLEKLDLNNSGFFGSKKEPNNMKVLEGFLRANLDVRDVSRASLPFFCPSLSTRQGTMSWQDRGPMWQAVAHCLAYPPLFLPQNSMAAALFSLDEVVDRLKSAGYNIIILVDVLGGGNLFDNAKLKDDYASAVLWSEARREIWRAKSRVTDVIDVNTAGSHLSDFSSRKMLVTAGEAAGDRAAKQLAGKYGF